MCKRLILILSLTAQSLFITEAKAYDCPSEAEVPGPINVCNNAQIQVAALSRTLPMTIDPITTAIKAKAVKNRIIVTIQYGASEADFKKLANTKGISLEDFKKTIGNDTQAQLCGTQTAIMFTSALEGEYEYVHLYRDGSIATTALISDCLGYKGVYY